MISSYPVISLSLFAVSGYLFAEFSDTCKLGFGSGHFDELYPYLLAVEFLIEIENVSLHVFCEGADGGLDAYVCDGRILHAVIDAVCDVDSVGRGHHGLVDHDV